MKCECKDGQCKHNEKGRINDCDREPFYNINLKGKGTIQMCRMCGFNAYATQQASNMPQKISQRFK